MSEHVCPSSDDLKSFVVGRLSEPEIAALAEHLDACASCASTIEAIEEDAGTSDGLVRALRNHEEGSDSLDPAEERAPSNLILTRTSAPVRGEAPGQGAVVKVLDLGLARLQDDHGRPAGETNEPSLTGTGQMMGTPEFISPEQVHDTHDVDIRADIEATAHRFGNLPGQFPVE